MHAEAVADVRHMASRGGHAAQDALLVDFDGPVRADEEPLQLSDEE